MKFGHEIARWLSKIRVEAVVLVLFVMLTLVFTYPVAFSANAIPGDGGDSSQSLWFLWMFKNALVTRTNPLFTSYIFYPLGVSLVFSTTAFFNAALSLPLQLLWDLPHAYTFLWLLSFVLSGFCAFLLVRYLGVSAKVAFVASLIFMFSPYRFAQGLGHLNLMATWWIPVFALFFLKTLREHKRSNAVFAGLVLALTAFSDFYYVIYLVTFSLLAVVYFFWRERQHTSVSTGVLKRIALAAIVFGALAAPLLIPMFQELLHGSYMYSLREYFVTFSADLAAYFIPSALHPMLRTEVIPFYHNLGSGNNIAESTVFIGFAGLTFSIIALLKQRTRDVWFWAISLGIFIMFSLGPVLHVNGVQIVRLPYVVLQSVPVFSIARVPSRWDVMVMLCVAVLSGFGLQYLVDRLHSSGRVVNKGLAAKAHVLCVICAGLILFEFCSIPYPTSPTAVPSFYQQISTDPDDYAIFEVAPYGYAPTMYYQTIHHKPNVNGYVSRLPPEALQFIEAESVARFLYHIQDLPTNASVNTTDLNPSVLAHYNIRYVIVHQELLTPYQVGLVRTLFNNTSQTPIVYKEGPMVVYATQPQS